MRSSPRFIFGRLKAEVRWCPAMADRLQGFVAEEWLSEYPARAAEKLPRVSVPTVRMGPALCRTVGSALARRSSSVAAGQLRPSARLIRGHTT
jgi:hypothetical protein